MGKPKPSSRDRDGKKDRKKDSKKPLKKKACAMCQGKVTSIDYKDITNLRKYVNEKSKIAARRTTGACARHQRMVAGAIKQAREMALLPYCMSR